jgi:DNA-binding MarR family transcriptional regulator
MDGQDIPPAGRAQGAYRQSDFLVQLRRTQHAVRNRLDADLSATGLTMPQYTVLAALDREGDLSSSDLARDLGMTGQTVNGLVKGRETAGLVRRTRHPNHGRILLAELTAAGRRSLTRGYAAGNAVQDRVLAGLSQSDRALLLRHLKTIERKSIVDET